MNRVALLLVALGVLVWWPALLGQPVYDDAINFEQNRALRELDLPALLAEPFFREHLHYWRPLTSCAAAIAWRGGFACVHLLALLLHAVSVGLLLRIARELGAEPRAAQLAAALFLVSPVLVESLGFASALGDVLAGACLLGAVACALSPRAIGLVAAALLLLAALLAKETALAMVPVVLWVASRSHGRARAWWSCASVACVLLGWWSLRTFVVGVPLGPAGSSGAFDLGERALGAVEVLGRLLALTAWPWPATPFAEQGGGGAAWFVGLLLVVAAIVACRFASSARLRWQLPTALLLVPVALPAALWPALGEFPVQERYLYVPAAGFALLVAPLLARRWWVGLAVVVVFGAFAHRQIGIWRSPRSFVEHGLATAPHLATVQVMAGDLWLRESREQGEAAVQQARVHYEAALRARFPAQPALASERRAGAFAGLGWCANSSASTVFPRDLERVLGLFRQSLIEKQTAVAHVGLGVALAQSRRFAEAEASLRAALRLDERLPEAWFNLGVLQLEVGDRDAARQSFAAALRCNPDLEAAREHWRRLGGR
jgi:tetratricopeptide (TPR) repeat protein